MRDVVNGGTRSRKRLLLVDDEPQVARAIAYAAEACGYDAAVAGTPAAFRAEYDAQAPDVALLDLSLASGDGIELLRFLSERDATCLVLVVSGFDQRVVEAAARLGGVLGLRMGRALTKPVMVGDLAQALAAGPVADHAGGEADALCLG